MSCSMTYINSQDDVTLLCIRNNSTRYLLDQNIDSKGSLTALPYRYISLNKSFWPCASKDPRVNIPNSRATAPSTPRAQALAASDLIHISGLQLSLQSAAQRGSTKSALECKSAHFLTLTSRLTNPKRGSVARAAVFRVIYEFYYSEGLATIHNSWH